MEDMEKDDEVDEAADLIREMLLGEIESAEMNYHKPKLDWEHIRNEIRRILTDVMP